VQPSHSPPPSQLEGDGLAVVPHPSAECASTSLAGNNTRPPISFETSQGAHVIQDNAIARQPRFAYLQGMEVHFTSEQEAQLAQLATKAGTDAEHLVKDAVL